MWDAGGPVAIAGAGLLLILAGTGCSILAIRGSSVRA